MRFVRDVLTTLVARIVGVILGVITIAVVARSLGSSGQGAYSLALLVPSMLGTFGLLGVENALVYFGSSKRYGWKELSANSFVLALLLGSALAVALLSYYWVAHPSFLEGVEPLWLTVATLTVPLGLLGGFFSAIILGQNRIVELNLVTLAERGLRLVLVVFLLLLLKGGVFAAIFASVAGSLASALLAIFVVSKTTPIRLGLDIHILKESVKFGIQGHLGTVIQFLNYRLDMFLIAAYLSTTALGYYSIAVTLAEALWYLPAAVGMVLLARTPGLSAEEANRLTPQICRNTLLVTILAGLVLFLLGRWVISLLFGDAFLPALGALWMLLPGVVVLSIHKVLANYLTARGKPILNTVANAVCFILNLPLNLLLIPRMGIEGAALASTVSYTLGAIVALVLFLRVSKVGLLDVIVVRPQDFRTYGSILSKGITTLQHSSGFRKVRADSDHP